MKIDLTGKTALVTGSTQGIGFAIAQGLAAAGAAVVVNGRTQAKVDAAMSRLIEAVPGAVLIGAAADVSTAAGCDALVSSAPAVDILVNNTGIFEAQDFFDTSDAEWSRFFETNVMSGVRLSRAYMKGMLARNWGRVVFIASESAINIPVEMIHYGFTKTANLSISRGLAKLTRGSAVTVNAVLPGPTRSEGVTAALKGLAEAENISDEEAGLKFIREHRSSSILQRMASTEEVANMVIYICSPQASATNGAALRVEGGIIEAVT